MSAPEAITAPSPDEMGPTVPFPVVGVGASAGGLEAFLLLLSHLPADPGVAFLFVMHLQPDYDSQLAELLTRSGPLPALQAADGMKVEVNRIYVLPPNKALALTD